MAKFFLVPGVLPSSCQSKTTNNYFLLVVVNNQRQCTRVHFLFYTNCEIFFMWSDSLCQPMKSLHSSRILTANQLLPCGACSVTIAIHLQFFSHMCLVRWLLAFDVKTYCLVCEISLIVDPISEESYSSVILLFTSARIL